MQQWGVINSILSDDPIGAILNYRHLNDDWQMIITWSKEEIGRTSAFFEHRSSHASCQYYVKTVASLIITISSVTKIITTISVTKIPAKNQFDEDLLSLTLWSLPSFISSYYYLPWQAVRCNWPATARLQLTVDIWQLTVLTAVRTIRRTVARRSGSSDGGSQVAVPTDYRTQWSR